MAIAKPVPYISAEEYLASEEASPVRREYVNGQICAMAGGSENHALISGNLFARLHQHLRGSGCRAFQENMKLKVAAANTVYYPDLFVTCEPVAGQSQFKTQAILIIEVLSESTKGVDRREKLTNSRKLASLREYVLIDQNKRRVEIYRQMDNGQWELLTVEVGEAVTFDSLPNGSLTLSMDEIYEDINITPTDDEE